jgi:hypothetical protein
MGDAIFVAQGHNGSIELFEDRVVIKHGGVMGLLTTGGVGDKTIPVEQISAVDFKENSFLTGFGFLRVNFAGANTIRGGISGVAHDENAVTFRGSQQEAFQKMKTLIQEKLQEDRTRRSSPTLAQVSPADELAKFADLRSKGIITDAEFEAKKKQLLGL